MRPDRRGGHEPASAADRRSRSKPTSCWSASGPGAWPNCVGFDAQDQTRITTAVSEIARNAFEYGGGGQVEFALTSGKPPQTLRHQRARQGAGDRQSAGDPCRVAQIGHRHGRRPARRAASDGRVSRRYRSGRGHHGRDWARSCRRGAPPVTASVLKAIAEELASDGPADAIEEIRQQNQQILLQMDQLKSRQEELERLNQELQDTNRGVVALYAELDERADHLRRADELKSKFLSNMSHEFRTPLNSILALSRLLLDRSDGELTGEQEKQVRFIRKAAREPDRTGQRPARPGQGRGRQDRRRADPSSRVKSMFGALRGMLRPLLVGDAVTLVFEDAVGLPPLDTDEGKVSQILRNFISNALKFTERGEVRVSAAADAEADTVTFTVRDTGIGIAPEDHELIFQEFGQVAHRPASAREGHRPRPAAVEKAGRAARRTHRGAERAGRRIDLRRHPAAILSATAIGQDDDADEIWSLEPGRVPVLAVEDDPADTFALKRILAGYALSAAVARLGPPGAAASLQQVAAGGDPARRHAAGDESWRLLLQLRQRGRYADIPLIVMSSIGRRAQGAPSRRRRLPRQADRSATRLLGLLDRLTGRQLDHQASCSSMTRRSRATWCGSCCRAAATACEAVGNGADGLQRLHDEPPDVVLLDINMPEMSGHRISCAPSQ